MQLVGALCQAGRLQLAWRHNLAVKLCRLHLSILQSDLIGRHRSADGLPAGRRSKLGRQGDTRMAMLSAWME
jgi:hypothetical protein